MLRNRPFAQQGAGHEEARNPLTAIARGAVRSADRPGGDRPALHIFARGHGADPAATPGGKPARLCRASCVLPLSRPDHRRGETPPKICCDLLPTRLGDGSKSFPSYAGRAQTRREHLGELQAYLNVRPSRREDCARLFQGGVGRSDRHGSGRCHCRSHDYRPAARGILLPAPVDLERIALAARARARKQAHKNLSSGLGP